MSKKLSISAALGACVFFMSPLASADYLYGAQRHYVISAIGPGSGHGAFAVGGRALMVNEEVAVPLIDLAYVRGLNNRFDFEGRLSTLGYLNLLDLGVRYRLAGDRDLSLGIRADATAIGVFSPVGDSSSSGIIGGVTPGVVLSGGGKNIQLSAGLDVPIFLGAASFDGTMARGSVGTLRPNVGVELALGNSTAMYLQGQYWFGFDQDGNTTPIGPMVGLGVTF